MHRPARLYRLISGLVSAALALAACAQPAPTTLTPANPPADGATPAAQDVTPALPPTAVPAAGPKTVIGAWPQEPDKLTPYFTIMPSALALAQLTLVGLAEWDEHGNYVPELAAEVPSTANGGISADGLTITWKLKPGLVWSDGEPLTSADVKFTYDVIMSDTSLVLQRAPYETIASVETPDATTVVLTFQELNPAWPTLFSQGPDNAGAILPAHVLTGKTALESNPYIRQPNIVSGPFVVTEWRTGDHLTLVPNERFYGGRPKLEQITLQFMPTPEAALAALQTGAVDWYPDFSEADLAALRALEGSGQFRSVVVPRADFEHYFFNLGTTAGVAGFDYSRSDRDGFCPFQDGRVRQAIVFGLDRVGMVARLLDERVTVPASPWPNSAWTNTTLQPEPYDPTRARALLDAAGYTDKDGDGIREGLCAGVETPLSFSFETTDKPLRVDLALAARASLAQIGVDFRPIHSPAGAFLANYSDGGVLPTGRFDMAGYTTGFFPDPYPAAGDWDCNIPSAANPIGTNNYHLCDPALVERLAAVNATADPAARKVALDALQQYLYDQAYVVMLYARASVYAFTPRFQPGPFGFYSGLNWNAERWDVVP